MRTIGAVTAPENAPESQQRRPRMILDCDPGLDDAVAIALALDHADLVGITTVGGNVRLEHTTNNALAITDLLGRPDIEVHAGHDLPISGSLEHRAIEYHGGNGLADVELPPPTRPAASDDAVEWIVETVRGEEGIWLVPTGPLTNVGLAIDRAPDLVGRLAGISWMGGSSTHGNTTVAAEFNSWVDPEAGDIVFRAGHPRLVMLGLNVTQTVLFDRIWIDELAAATADSPRAVFAELLAHYDRRQRSMTTLAGAAIHDALAVLRVTHPHLLSGPRRAAEVVVAHGPTRGMTLVDRRPRRSVGDANVEVVEWADAGAIRDVVFATLTGSAAAA